MRRHPIRRTFLLLLTLPPLLLCSILIVRGFDRIDRLEFNNLDRPRWQWRFDWSAAGLLATFSAPDRSNDAAWNASSRFRYALERRPWSESDLPDFALATQRAGVREYRSTVGANQDHAIAMFVPSLLIWLITAVPVAYVLFADVTGSLVQFILRVFRAVIIASSLSLALLISVLWWRSYAGWDAIFYPTAKGETMVCMSGGGVVVRRTPAPSSIG